IGQRRIGKTTVLLRLRDSHLPEPRRICAIFMDVSGLLLLPGRSVARALFEFIAERATSRSENPMVVAALDDATQRRIDAGRDEIAKNLDPDRDFASALERLVDRLTERSHGVIGRVA